MGLILVNGFLRLDEISRWSAVWPRSFASPDLSAAVYKVMGQGPVGSGVIRLSHDCGESYHRSTDSGGQPLFALHGPTIYGENGGAAGCGPAIPGGQLNLAMPVSMEPPFKTGSPVTLCSLAGRSLAGATHLVVVAPESDGGVGLVRS